MANQEDSRSHESAEFSKKITVRVTPDVYDGISEIATRNHISKSECFRLLVSSRLTFKKVNVDAKSRDDLLHALAQFFNVENDHARQLSGLSNNLNQLTKLARANKSINHADDLTRQMDALTRLLNEYRKILEDVDMEVSVLCQQLE